MCYDKECTDERFQAFCDILKELSEKEYAVVLDFCSVKGSNGERIEGVAKKYNVDIDTIKQTLYRAIAKMRHPVRAKKIFNN